MMKDMEFFFSQRLWKISAVWDREAALDTAARTEKQHKNSWTNTPAMLITRFPPFQRA